MNLFRQTKPVKTTISEKLNDILKCNFVHTYMSNTYTYTQTPRHRYDMLVYTGQARLRVLAENKAAPFQEMIYLLPLGNKIFNGRYVFCEFITWHVISKLSSDAYVRLEASHIFTWDDENRKFSRRDIQI